MVMGPTNRKYSSSSGSPFVIVTVARSGVRRSRQVHHAQAAVRFELDIRGRALQESAARGERHAPRGDPRPQVQGPVHAGGLRCPRRVQEPADVLAPARDPLHREEVLEVGATRSFPGPQSTRPRGSQNASAAWTITSSPGPPIMRAARPKIASSPPLPSRRALPD